jgi:hypothetical protein
MKTTTKKEIKKKGGVTMKRKGLIITVAVMVLISFITVSSAQAVIDPVSLTIIGFSLMAVFIPATKAVKHHSEEGLAEKKLAKQTINKNSDTSLKASKASTGNEK